MKYFIKNSVRTLMAIIISQGSAFAQTKKGESALTHQLAAINFNTFINVVNYPKTNIKLSDLYKKKAILLDFGNTMCGGCVANLPLLDSLQRKLKDKLIVIWVTDNTKEEIVAFLTSSKIGRKISLPIITDDKILHDLFMSTGGGIPQEVLINVYGQTMGQLDARFMSGPLLYFLANLRVGSDKIYPYTSLWKDPQ